MAHKKEVRQKAKDLYVAGLSCREIARQLKISPDTVWRWRKEEDWEEEKTSLLASRDAILQKIQELTSDIEVNEATARAMDKLTKAFERLDKIEKKKKPEKKKQKKLPGLAIEYVGSLYEKWLDRLYKHQRKWVLMPERFRCLLKSRQTGFSMTTGGEALFGAIGYRPHINKNKLVPEDQVVISASRDQSEIVRRYVEFWADELGIDVVPDKKSLVVPGGKHIYFLPCNYRTIQGYSGDLFLDEFAWHPRNERIYNVAAPIVTVNRKRFTLLSTPYVPYDKFGEIWFNKNEYGRFARVKISIHDAIKAGMEIDLEEIRSLFDEETFKIMYECSFFSDESSLLTYAEIEDAKEIDGSSVEEMSFWDGPSDAGYDVGRKKDVSVLSVVGDMGAFVRMLALRILRRESFDRQKQVVRDTLAGYPGWGKLRIDETGMGIQLVEDLAKLYGKRVEGIWFTREKKTEMALGLKSLFEERRIKIINDRILIAHLLAIKRKATDSGLTFDADRTAETGHGDCFWSLALACLGHTRGRKAIIRRGCVI
jgi:phage FluMu gp28-like protein